MPNAFAASTLSAPCNHHLAASPRIGRAAQPRSTAMPLAAAPSTANTPRTPENIMSAAHTLTTKKPDRITLVPHAPANTNAGTPPRTPRPPVEAEELPLLRPSEVNHVASEEISFFFAADPAGHDAADQDGGAAEARAIIAGWIAELAPCDQEALALYHEPEPWPESVREEGLDYESGYALVLACASASQWRPRGKRSYAAEQAANEQLRAAVFQHGPRALRHLTRRAEWDFATALCAYIRVRGRAPRVLGRSAPDPKEAR
jgi:hypothetical protein